MTCNDFRHREPGVAGRGIGVCPCIDYFSRLLVFFLIIQRGALMWDEGSLYVEIRNSVRNSLLFPLIQILLIVLSTADGHEMCRLDFQDLFETGMESLIESTAGQPERHGRTFTDFLTEFKGLVFQFCRRNNVIHHTDPIGLIGINKFSGEGKLLSSP